MSMSDEKIKKLAREDYRNHEERLRIWIDAAEEMLQSGENLDVSLFDLFYAARIEFLHRRTLFAKEKTPLEIRGSDVLDEVMKRIKEKMWDEVHEIDWWNG